jgi:hypothetical protein
MRTKATWRRIRISESRALSAAISRPFQRRRRLRSTTASPKRRRPSGSTNCKRRRAAERTRLAMTSRAASSAPIRPVTLDHWGRNKRTQSRRALQAPHEIPGARSVGATDPIDPWNWINIQVPGVDAPCSSPKRRLARSSLPWAAYVPAKRRLRSDKAFRACWPEPAQVLARVKLSIAASRGLRLQAYGARPIVLSSVRLRANDGSRYFEALREDFELARCVLSEEPACVPTSHA